ncbi:intein C-terminal splicing region/intein N-terminal splicing region [Amycolatopsis arida]|uniref:Intein C-terminal splicing region/intein N-terminal splicing region n=1 Tax=Amycolatopsis arida TaxID=587909 RepID=A0A1I5Z525_9PSEU|nr:intein/intein [Amycolatopsis arida]SFQ51550.1 intein C-terminal splicing region/intein N-terminal splicing region [Amycolatopsis arida]
MEGPGVEGAGQTGDPVEGEGEQAPLALPGLVRTVRSPEFAGVTFHEVRAKSVLNKVPETARVPFRWTVNPYRGCSHACAYCLAGDTPILMADGSYRALAELTVGDEIYGTVGRGVQRRLVRTRVLAHWATVKPAYRVTLADGTRLVASADHRFLTDRGWKHVIGTRFGASQRPHLTTRNRMVGTGAFAVPPPDNAEYRAGYLCAVIRDDAGLGAHRFRLGVTDPHALARARHYLAAFGIPADESVYPPGLDGPPPAPGASAGFAAVAEMFGLPDEPSADWHRGFLAGAFDADGQRAHGLLRLGGDEPGMVALLRAALGRFGFRHSVSGGASGGTGAGADTGSWTLTVFGGLDEHLRFFHSVGPAAAAKRVLDGAPVSPGRGLGVTSVEPVGLELPLFDITTGTGDFIANGVVSHNCFARDTHTYLDFDAGRDFDTQVVVKVNAPEVLAAQLRRPSWPREHVAMGTNTDPYQRAEGRYRLMPGIISALGRSGTPFSILTKGTVLGRDLSLLRAVSADVPVGLGVSLALLDRDLQRGLEPGTPSPRARLELVRRIRDAGLPCGVFVAPVLPELTDSTEALDALLGEIAAAGATGVTVLPLHLRPGAREWFGRWLARRHPELVPRYRRLYARGSYLPAEYRRRLADRVAPLVRRHGLDRHAPGEARDTVSGQARDGAGERREWPRGAVPEPGRDRGGDQLSLLGDAGKPGGGAPWPVR